MLFSLQALLCNNCATSGKLTNNFLLSTIQSNPVQRKNKDLKLLLEVFVGNNHQAWKDKLPLIRFALNTAKCDTTGQSAAFLQFARELRTLDADKHDVKVVTENNNFASETTPYFKRFVGKIQQLREKFELHQDKHKKYADNKIQQTPKFTPGDKVWVTLHPIRKVC